jgi:hypothetical protein
MNKIDLEEKMFPTKRQIEQSLKRNAFSAFEAKRYIALWDSKGLLTEANWDGDIFLFDMKATSRVTSDLLRRADIILH